MNNQPTMNIQNQLRILLEEQANKNTKHDYGCVMIFLDITKDGWSALLDLVDDEDVYTEEGDSGYGKETTPHATILYGLHGDIEDEDVEAIIDEVTKPDIELKKVSMFENDKFDVLKFDVESDDLNKYNKMFTKLPHTNKYPDYHPHTTIAYLKKGAGDKYVKLLNKREPLSVKPVSVVYSKTDGTKKTYKIK